MCAADWGVLQNYVKTHMWFNIASVNDSKYSAESRDIVVEQIIIADNSKVQAIARECMNRNYNKCGY